MIQAGLESVGKFSKLAPHWPLRKADNGSCFPPTAHFFTDYVPDRMGRSERPRTGFNLTNQPGSRFRESDLFKLSFGGQAGIAPQALRFVSLCRLEPTPFVLILFRSTSRAETFCKDKDPRCLGTALEEAGEI